jgi:hypothetical protein
MGEQLKRLHGSLAELLAERDHYAAEAADAESKRSDLEQEVLRFRTVFMWHTAYGAKVCDFWNHCLCVFKFLSGSRRLIGCALISCSAFLGVGAGSSTRRPAAGGTR